MTAVKRNRHLREGHHYLLVDQLEEGPVLVRYERHGNVGWFIYGESVRYRAQAPGQRWVSVQHAVDELDSEPPEPTLDVPAFLRKQAS